MEKTTIKKKSKAIYKVLATFVALLLIVGVLFAVLKMGFEVEKFQTKLFKAEKLYIKLDKKLIVRAQNLEIFDEIFKEDSSKKGENFDENLSKKNAKSESKTGNSNLAKINDNARFLKYLYLLFDDIDINSIKVKGQDFSVLFRDEHFFAKNEHFLIKVNIEHEENLITANIAEFTLKDLNASLSGIMQVDTKSENYNFLGAINSPQNRLDLHLHYDGKHVYFKLANVDISSIGEVFDYLKIRGIKFENDLDVWLGKRVVGKFYHLDYLSGQIEPISKAPVKALEGVGYVKNLTIKLADNLKSIEIPYLDLNLTTNKLDFSFKKASFAGKDISKSKVFIYDLPKAGRSGIDLKIRSNELRLDDDLLALLNHYDVPIPLKQLSGSLKSDFSLRISFSHPDKEHAYKGRFETQNANFDLLKFYAKQGVVELETGKVRLKDFSVQNDFLKGDFNATIDIASKSGVFDTKIHRIFFKEILDLRDESASLRLNFDETQRLREDAWDIRMDFTKGLRLNARKLGKFKPYSPLMQRLDIVEADELRLKTDNFVNFDIDLMGVRFDTGFVRQDGSAYNTDDFKVLVSKKMVKVSSVSDFINANVVNDKVSVNAKNLGYKFESVSQLSGSGDMNLQISATNFALIVPKISRQINFDDILITNKNGLLLAKAKKDEALFELKSTREKLIVDFENLNDKILNEFWQREVFDGGEFYLHLDGSNTDEFTARIVGNETILRDFRGHNSLISFLDSVPSLALFRTPTFNDKGLEVKQGVLLFNAKGDKIDVEAITIDGESVDVLGNGEIDLDSGQVDFDLELQTLKSTTDLLDKIPILNQVILGSDRVISTRLRAYGDINDIKFQSQIVGEVLKLPVSIIKNIIDVPASWFK